MDKQRIIPLIVAAALFMENMDSTVIATSLPAIAVDIGSNPLTLKLAITSYLLSLAVFIPASGWTADRFGARRVFSIAICLFMLGSIGCALSHSITDFVLARILQGMGGAMMTPVGRLVLLRSIDKSALVGAMAWVSTPALIGPVLGPPLGGFITTYSSWRWIFYLNVPLGMLGIVLAWRFIAAEGESQKRPFDGIGFALCGIAGTAIMYAMELLGRSDAPWREALAFLAAGLAAGIGALFHLRRSAHPVVDLTAFRIKTFAVAMGGGSLFRVSISAVPFLLPLMFQLGFGMNAFHSGLLTLIVFAGNLSMKLVTTPVMRRFGFRPVLLVNGALAAISIAAMSLLTASTPLVPMAVVLFASGLSRSLQFTAVNTLAFADVPKPQMSGASTLSSTLSQMTMGMGVALGAIALRVAAWLHGHEAQSVTPADFSIAFLLVAAVGLVAIIDVFGLERDAGAHVSGHHGRKRA